MIRELILLYLFSIYNM